MENTKSTPGPWIAFGSIVKAGVKNIARVSVMAESTEDEANAELIAQAPELLRQRDELLAALRRLMPIASALVCNPAASQAERECHASEHALAQTQARQAIASAEKGDK